MRQMISQTKRWVIKIGSSLLTADGKGLDPEAMSSWVKQMVTLREAGIELILVSSGAIAAGMSKLNWDTRPKEMHKLQAAAAVGQMILVQAWENCFDQFNCQAAQILLTHEDLSDRQRYLNARTTLRTLVELNIIPVINENDTVTTDEIQFGDNDTLAALVANLVEADLLVILTDRDGMFDADPRTNPNAQLITETKASDSSLDKIAGGAGSLGRGGMQTKLRAARFAARSGTNTIIVGGKIPNVITKLQHGEKLGTLLVPDHTPIAARKQWLAGQLQVRGKITLDDGAVKALLTRHKSLLPVGVRQVTGDFSRGEIVSCINNKGDEIARGLVNYSANEARQIMGLASDEIERTLGFLNEPELIHKDNLIIHELLA
ncbi:glutamate 5-kinase [Entomomonas moraniae]|uniref:Glutamate 5-kinase n=1 Tax=Entomomonas moraniae TaxID=2213226 RepID=A0A3Q9JNU9_9GAMM|nr:glutamate 5-kinase [Entomomonas moraniae]AZS51369.1 glutamate 5-kinase [Entomomonas moraniae]